MSRFKLVHSLSSAPQSVPVCREIEAHAVVKCPVRDFDLKELRIVVHKKNPGYSRGSLTLLSEASTA